MRYFKKEVPKAFENRAEFPSDRVFKYISNVFINNISNLFSA